MDRVQNARGKSEEAVSQSVSQEENGVRSSQDESQRIGKSEKWVKDKERERGRGRGWEGGVAESLERNGGLK